MNNNIGYGGFPSSNSSFSSFSSQYASTPTNNSQRFQRPRFAYAGPPSYPRPRSSASKPNPDPYDGSFQNSSYDSYDISSNSPGNNAVDYSHGYMDSMRNNFGDSSLPLNESSSLNQSRNSFDDSSSYFTCNESFYQSPHKPDYNYNANSSSNRGGHSSFSNPITSRRIDNFPSTNIGGSALYNNDNIGLQSTDSFFRGITGNFATSTKGTLGLNTRGNRGTFGQNRGNTRGRFQKKRPFGRGGSRFPNSMASKIHSTWRCEVCSINFTSQVPFDMHLRGTKHAKKLKIQNAFNSVQGQIAQSEIKVVDKPDGKKFYCELCDVIANSSLQLQMHLDGTKHKNKVTQSAENKEETKETKSETKETKVEIKETKEIAEDKSLKVKEELNGKSNGSGVRRPAPAEFGEAQPTKMAKFSCDICNVIVNSDIQLQQHLSSKKHQAKVEGKPFKPRKFVKKQDGDSAQPMEQSETTDEPKVETKSVVGVKTLSASFVKSDTVL